MLVALAVVGISVAVGLLFGAGVALLPRLLRPAGTSVIDLVLGVPGIVVAIAIVGALGPGVRNVVVALAAVGWAWYARLTEEHTRDLLRSRFVDAALVAGVSPARVLATHVLPHVAHRRALGSAPLLRPGPPRQRHQYRRPPGLTRVLQIKGS